MLVDALRLSTFGLFSAMGGWVLYTDFRYQKVRNSLIVTGLWFAAAAYGVALLATFLSTVGLLGAITHTWGFYRALALHAALASAAALALWRLEIWPAGDAKLFALFSLLLPLVEPNLPAFPTWLFMVCLINVFLPPAFWIVARALLWAGRRASTLADPGTRAALRAKAAETLAAWRADPKALREKIRERSLNVLYYMAFFLVLFAIRQHLPEPIRWTSPLVSVTALMGTSWLERRYALKRGFLLPYVSVGAVVMVAFYGPAAAARVLATCMYFALTIGLAADLAYRYLAELETREVPVDDLAPYQVLAPGTLEALRSDIVFLGENFNLTTRDGIQPLQLAPLKDWLRKRGVPAVTVYNTAPFAPWIVLGFCLTLLLRADIAWLMRPGPLGGGLHP